MGRNSIKYKNAEDLEFLVRMKYFVIDSIQFQQYFWAAKDT